MPLLERDLMKCDHDRRPRSNRPRANRSGLLKLGGVKWPMLAIALVAPFLTGCPTQRTAYREHVINMYSEHHATMRTHDYMQTWNETLDQRAGYHYSQSGNLEEAIDKAIAESDDLRAGLMEHIRKDRMGKEPAEALLVSVENHSRERLRNKLVSLATAEE